MSGSQVREHLGRHATGVEKFPFDYEIPKIIFIPVIPGVTRKWVNGTDVSKGSQEEIRPIFREESKDLGMSRLFSERA